MNPTEMHALHEKIFGLMLKAGWLERFTFTNDKGWHTTWSGPGAQRAILLRNIIESHRLDSDDRMPVAFTIGAQGGGFGIIPNVTDRDVLAFWRQCREELGLELLADDCLVFVHIILGWGPECS